MQSGALLLTTNDYRLTTMWSPPSALPVRDVCCGMRGLPRRERAFTKFVPTPPPGDACDCICHRAPLAVLHSAPCCVSCPSCGRRVASARLTPHIASHNHPLPER